MDRISLRVNNHMGTFVKSRAGAFFDGEVSEYVRYLITKDMEAKTPFQVKEADHWQQQVDTQIADLQAKIELLTTVKKDIELLRKDPIPEEPAPLPP